MAFRAHGRAGAFWILCLLPAMAGCRLDERVPAESAFIHQNQALEKVKQFDAIVRLDVGSMEITRAENAMDLYALDLTYDKNGYTPDIRYEAAQDKATGRLDFGLRSLQRGGVRRENHGNRLHLALNGSVPAHLKIATGVGDARLALSGLQLAQLEFEAGVGSAKLTAYEPNPISCASIRLKNGVGSLEAVGLANLNFRELEFDGGVGGANLDFTGEWKQNADIRIQVGVGGVNIRLPREIGVKVEAEKHFLSGLQLEGFTQRDDAYYSENFGQAAIQVTVRVTTGIGGLKLTWV